MDEEIIDKKYKINLKFLLGRGTFSRVYLGYDQEESRKVAIKQIEHDMIPEEHIQRISSEISLVKKLNHPNIVRTYDVITISKKTFIIMEYCGGGDLAQLIKTEKIREEKARYYLYQLMKGLEYLRSKNILHRDLKPANLLLSDDKRILKIADFGFAKVFVEDDLSQTLCGSPLYMAPEMFFEGKYTSKSDLWSVGMILYQLLYTKTPYSDARNQVELRSMMVNVPISYSKNVHLSMECYDLLHNLLQKDSSIRISWSEFYNHLWWKGYIQDIDLSMSISPLRVASRDLNSHNIDSSEFIEKNSSYNSKKVSIGFEILGKSHSNDNTNNTNTSINSSNNSSKNSHTLPANPFKSKSSTEYPSTHIISSIPIQIPTNYGVQNESLSYTPRGYINDYQPSSPQLYPETLGRTPPITHSDGCRFDRKSTHEPMKITQSYVLLPPVSQVNTSSQKHVNTQISTSLNSSQKQISTSLNSSQKQISTSLNSSQKQVNTSLSSSQRQVNPPINSSINSNTLNISDQETTGWIGMFTTSIKSLFTPTLK
jgi:serine/threonine protein kinase